MKTISFRSLGPAACLLALASAAACAPAGEESGSAADQVKLEGKDLPTSLTQLRAGEPFAPGVDETLVEIGSPCIDGAEVTVTGGNVTSSASVVQNRESLERELGLEVSGMIPQAAGVTGSLGISKKTTFDRQSAVILLQATGTYKSVLKKIGSELPTFSASDVSRCGYGYITEASHRVSAALVVTVRSNDEGSEVKANAGVGKEGVANVKANLSNIISKGNLEVSVRFATDIIPNLPDAPIGDAVIVVGSDDGAKQQAMEKLNSSLNWLAQAHASIQNYLNDLQTGAETAAPAPTKSVKFRFFPTTPAAVRKAVEVASDNAFSLRQTLGQANIMMDDWNQFATEADQGTGFHWNVPGNPAGTVDELKARKREMMDDNGGKLRTHHDRVDEMLADCISSLRNDEANEDSDLSASIMRSCSPAPALPFDKNSNELREIITASVSESTNDSVKCPAGYRKPLEAESKLFAPWSRQLKASVDMGIWMEKSGCKFSSGWIYDGSPQCTTFATVKKGKTICVSADKGPTPAE